MDEYKLKCSMYTAEKEKKINESKTYLGIIMYLTNVFVFF